MAHELWLALAVVWLASAFLELTAGRSPARQFGRLAAYIGQACSAASAGILLALNVNLLAVLFLILALYREVNLFRILAARLERHNLRQVSTRTSWVLLAAELAVLALAYYWPKSLTASLWLELLSASQLVVAIIFASNFRVQLRRAKFIASNKHLSQRELPTLTVAIPAKDETSDLEECLASLLANDYPKLEVLVLDDSAGGKTGEIIRALAHDGVRFILGEKPTSRWLAKNLAYDRLAEEANGELILFCGVDVRFGPNSLRSLVDKLVADGDEMISVMPLNRRNYHSLIIQPMRYFWELARPRFGASYPVLSTCWLVRKDLLAKAGGFKAIASEIVPERFFAKLAAKDGKYSFIRSEKMLALASAKSSAEQRATAIRTRYPLLHRHLASVAGASLFTFTWLVVPFALIIVLPFYGWSLGGEIFAVVASVLWLVIYGAIIKLQFGVSPLAAPAFLLAALADIALANYSLAKYEFGQVLWKGRDAARPVMGLSSNSQIPDA